MNMHKRYKPIFQKDQLRDISRQICQGLKYMQNQSVIHCDMKPENILFTDEQYNRVKIIDFGASCEDCSTGFFYVQSRYYRAPEIVLGLHYDHAVDMWSLGCILYELVCGSPLFPAHDENELFEYFVVTIGEFPGYMLSQAKKYKQFYSQPGGKLQHLIRSQASCLGDHIVPKSQTLDHLLNSKAAPEMINFIKKCLALEPEDRMTP
jgi:dual specificity tyrosine-phosphorylation-regulated kinase 2/3/4